MTIDTHGSIDPLAREWDELADRLGAVPWLRPGWMGAWWRAFGRGSMTVLTLTHNGRLVGAVSLERRNGSLASMSNWHTPAFGVLAEDEGAASELMRAAFAAGGRRVTLSFVPADDPSLAACLSAGSAAGYRLIVRSLERSPYVVVDGEWDAYLSRRPAKLLRELRRRRRRLHERGSLTFELADGTERLDGLLDEGFRVEAAGWKGQKGTAIASHPATRGFYTSVARWAAERGWLRLGFLRLDGRAIAFDFSVEQGGTLYLLKTGYDEAYRGFAPGMIIRQEMLCRAFSSRLSRYEFLGDVADWKLEWAERSRELDLVQGFAPSALGIVDWAAFAFGRPIAKRALAWRST
jgi:CelD/BcsL family acetyltransferase involved in cellulose biosynthesis